MRRLVYEYHEVVGHQLEWEDLIKTADLRRHFCDWKTHKRYYNGAKYRNVCLRRLCWRAGCEKAFLKISECCKVCAMWHSMRRLMLKGLSWSTTASNSRENALSSSFHQGMTGREGNQDLVEYWSAKGIVSYWFRYVKRMPMEIRHHLSIYKIIIPIELNAFWFTVICARDCDMISEYLISRIFSIAFCSNMFLL